ncbi:alpha/beta hydrolase [Dethiothermospora halolimnae]|uniref:alpha/beta hydrolase n=1 Tax=Dethiothermospora halolimnae TaxID=3114390 RepID=UPI003CCC3AE9
MKYNSFKELEKAYSVPKYMEALTLLKNGMKNLPEEEFQKHLFTIMLDRAQLHSKSGLYDECLKDLTYLVDRGYVCPLFWSRFSDPFTNSKEYTKIREKNDFLRNQQQENVSFEWEVLLPQNYTEGKKYPLFITLHGDGDNIAYHKEFWKPKELLNKGFIVAYIQSSQLDGHNGYTWTKTVFYSPDQKNWPDSEQIRPVSKSSYEIKQCYDSAYDEIKRCYEAINNEYSIDENSIIIGGFSGGSSAAIEIALTNTVPVKGFIALCSAKSNLFTKENVKGLLHRGVKGVFMDGEKDLPVQEVEEMMKDFKDIGVPYQYYINDGIGHSYPDDLNDKLVQGVDFILK